MKEKLKPLTEEIELPQEANALIEGTSLTIKKNERQISKKMPGVNLEKKENKIIIKTQKSTKREKKQIKTILSHVKNMIKGMEEDFTYKLQICSLHFPMTLSIKENFVIIKNFLGETKERKARILEGSEVKIENDIITVTSSNKEAAGQTAANIEKITRVRNKDRRIFQDGVFMIEKSGKRI